MFLKLKRADTENGGYPKEITLNTDQIVYYFGFRENTSMIHFSDGTGVEAFITESELDDILVYKNCDPTPVKEIDDNPLNFSTDPEPIEEDISPNERLATEKQISYMKAIREKKGLKIKFPRNITFRFAKDFLDKYAGKIKKEEPKPLNFKDLDEDADGEFPGYRD